jgi:hypothetical protein
MLRKMIEDKWPGEPRYVRNSGSLICSERRASLPGTSAATCTPRIDREYQSFCRNLEFDTSVNVRSLQNCPLVLDRLDRSAGERDRGV